MGSHRTAKQVFGILSETGKYPSTTLFDYHAVGGQVELVDLKKTFALVVPAKCTMTFEVIGITHSGAIAVEISSAEKCAPNSRWLINPASQKPQPLPQGASIRSLYH
jgi:hypothetical protein